MLTLLSLLGVAFSFPSVTLYSQYNNAYNVAVSKGVSRGGTVVYLGSFETSEECQAACVHQTPRCWSFVHFDDSNSFAKQCFSVASPGFNPSYDPTATTGVVHWGCRNEADCSFNGACNSDHVCVCRKAWKGEKCEQLALQPAVKGSGYRGVDGGHNTSSWGGSVLKGQDGKYHMWAAEMTNHCGIGAWQHSSHIIHAVSTNSYAGPYKRVGIPFGVFSHEPVVTPGPNGEFVMFFTATAERNQTGNCDCCRPGIGPCDGSTGPGDCQDPVSPYNNVMSFSTSPDGPWSEPVQYFQDGAQGDSNFAAVILQNGSLVGMWRNWKGGDGPFGGSRVHLATASNWKDPTSYQKHPAELFPDLGAAGTEDQFVYLDEAGVFHAVFHHMYGTGTQMQWWLDATGGHAFSTDGWNWTYTGVAWGDPLARYNTPQGQGARVNFTDGTSFKYTRLERPHLIFRSNRFQGDPVALVSAAQYGAGTDPGISANNDDACMTLIQPVL